jgi:hypothetical protein
VEWFSSPLIPYGIYGVKIRRNRGRRFVPKTRLNPIEKEII